MVIAKYFCLTFRSAAQCLFTEPLTPWQLWLFTCSATDGCGCLQTEPLMVVVVYMQNHWWLWLFPYRAADGCGCLHTEPLIVVVVYIQSHWWLWLLTYEATDGCSCLHTEPLMVVVVYIQSHWCLWLDTYTDTVPLTHWQLWLFTYRAADGCGCLPCLVLFCFSFLFPHIGGKTWTLQNQTNLWVHLKTLTSSPVHCSWYSGRAPVSWPQNQTPLLAEGHHVIQGSNHEWVRVTAGRQRSWSSEPGKRQRRQRHPCGDWRWNRVSSDKQ